MKRLVKPVLFVVITAFLSSCGVASIHEVKEGQSISKEELMKTPKGTGEEDVLARFGEPSRVAHLNINGKKEDVWFYCWKKGTSGSVLFGLVGGTSVKAKCATFIFRDDKLISKGIGKGANAELAPTIRIQKEVIQKKDNGDNL